MQLQASYSTFFTTFVINQVLGAVADVSGSIAMRLKRILFVFSVFSSIDSRHGVNSSVIKTINGSLHLSQTPEVCVASAIAGRCLWPETQEQTLSDRDVRAIATNPIERDFVTNYFVRRCPLWLCYGSPDRSDMRRDLKRLFKVIITRNDY